MASGNATTFLQQLLKVNCGCVRLQFALDYADRLGVDLDELREAYKAGDYTVSCAAGVRYLHKKRFNFSAYRDWLEDCDAVQARKAAADNAREFAAFAQPLDDLARFQELEL